MADRMDFPATVEEFMEQYKITDTEEVYTNGIELVPIFRMKQWFDRHPPADVVPVRHGTWLPIVSYNNTYKCSECGRLLVDITDGLKMVAKNYPYCHCGAKMDKE